VKANHPVDATVSAAKKAVNKKVIEAINGMKTHAEMDAVAISILGGDVDVEITINNPNGPCLNCQAGAKALLKNGVTLTVHHPGGGKTVIPGTR
jgi:hypothetical protein